VTACMVRPTVGVHSFIHHSSSFLSSIVLAAEHCWHTRILQYWVRGNTWSK